MVAHQETINSTLGYGIIYMFTSPSGKQYIGQSIQFRERYSNYRTIKKSAIGKKFYNALKKYEGVENFELTILASISLSDSMDVIKAELDKLEKFYIHQYNTYRTGYNSTIGGEGSYGRIVSQETRDKIGKANLGNNAVEDIQCTCGKCGKEFGIQPWTYNRRIKQSKTGNLFCSSKCTAEHNRKETFVTINCEHCNKEITYPTHMYNRRMKDSKSKKLFCDVKCYRAHIKNAT